jgi:hypothetical protein
VKSNSESENYRPAWPSVDSQLRASNVRPGSALDKLIRNHQDLSILRPDEVDDNLPFPPWLRVYWRKSHPELDFSGPRVGYPLILSNVWEWMMRNQDLSSESPPSRQKKAPRARSRRS